MIHQGDKYSLPVSVKAGTTVIKPTNCTDVKIKLNGTAKTYSDEELTFDTSSNCWLYPLTEAETLALDYAAVLEVAVKFSTGEIIKSTTQVLQIASSIIKEAWT